MMVMGVVEIDEQPTTTNKLPLERSHTRKLASHAFD